MKCSTARPRANSATTPMKAADSILRAVARFSFAGFSHRPLLALLLPLLTLHAQAADDSRRVVDVMTFGAKPDDGVNDLAALRAALAEAKKVPGTTLRMPPGRYDLSDPEAIKLQETVLSGAWGNNPERRLFNRDCKYVTALDFSGARKITLDAKGAELLVDGWMEPLALQNCSDVTLRGVRIDFKRPPNSEGTITAVGNGTVDVKFPDAYPVTAGMPAPRIMVYDEKERALVGGGFYGSKKELIAPQTLRFDLAGSQLQVGRKLLMWHSFHFRPAILLYLADNTLLEDVTINANPGMGVVGHLCENISIKRLRVVPKPGRHIATNTDATHFVSCCGRIRFDDCEFEGQGDDATNVHVFYTDILSKQGEGKCVMDINRRFETHSVKRDLPRVGDTLAIIRRKSLEEAGSVKVLAVDPDPNSHACSVTFEGTLPDDFQNYLLANTSACPALEFVNCRSVSHRARCVLVKTRKVLIEGCRFENATGTAIHIGAEGDWMEGPGSADVIVRNNRFVRCGFADGTVGGANAVALEVNASRRVPGIHKRVLIEDNTIEGGNNGISVSCAEDVMVRRNRFTGQSGTPVSISNSRGVTVKGNQGAEDQKVP